MGGIIQNEEAGSSELTNAIGGRTAASAERLQKHSQDPQTQRALGPFIIPRAASPPAALDSAPSQWFDPGEVHRVSLAADLLSRFVCV